MYTFVHKSSVLSCYTRFDRNQLNPVCLKINLVIDKFISQILFFADDSAFIYLSTIYFWTLLYQFSLYSLALVSPIYGSIPIRIFLPTVKNE